MLQFKSGGHLIAFSENSVHFAALDHMMKIEFVGGKARPVSENGYGKGENDEAPEFQKVTYDGLWPGVEVVYEKEAGSIAKVTYIVNDAASAGRIHLKYNRDLNIDGNGNLELNFETGKMIENAPVAWQVINGQRKYVQTGFNLLNTTEIGFNIGSHNVNYPIIIDPSITWHTFLGGASIDQGYGIAVDGSGNVYITGYSYATWGTPVNAYTGDSDAFVAKLNSSGSLQWHTFLGSTNFDRGIGIALDGSGNVYITGYSNATWGTPINTFAGNSDTFVAKLNSSGAIQWHTFMGGTNSDNGKDIALDGSGNIYISGYSYTTWGTPINAFAGTSDAFLAKLNNSGVLQWHTFLGGAGYDEGWGIALDGSGNIYTTGYSYATWGTPINVFAGNTDGFVAKLNNSGVLQWNTFLGGSNFDITFGIALDGSSNIYVTGYSYATWGSPVNAFVGTYENALVAKVNNSGVFQWHTFMGSSSDAIYGYDIAVDAIGRAYTTGIANASWGSPLDAYSGGEDTFLAVLNQSGTLNFNTFFGSSDDDGGYGIVLDGSFNAHITGYSASTWGSPINSHAGGNNDAFVIKYISGLSIPTLTEWTAIILGIGLALIAVWQIRRFFA